MDEPILLRHDFCPSPVPVWLPGLRRWEVRLSLQRSVRLREGGRWEQWGYRWVLEAQQGYPREEVEIAGRVYHESEAEAWADLAAASLWPEGWPELKAAAVKVLVACGFA
jgi:hypothetical protein